MSKSKTWVVWGEWHKVGTSGREIRKGGLLATPNFGGDFMLEGYMRIRIMRKWASLFFELSYSDWGYCDRVRYEGYP